MDLTVEQAPVAPPLRYPLSFDGSGGEYFKIWIVNLALTVVTLGVFSAWAKVRSTRYFYGNTYIGEYNFDYHADPIRILIGRAIAFIILLAYGLSAAFAPLLMLIIAPVLFFATPWLVNAALRFNARNTSYRNIRFNFTATYGDAFVAYIGWPLLAVITLGTTYPLARRARTQFNINNHSFGGKKFDVQIPGGAMYKIYLKAFAMLLVCMIALMIFVGIIAGSAMVLSGSEKAVNHPLVTVLAGAGYMAVVLLLMTYVGTRVFNLAVGLTTLAGRFKFESTLSAASMIGLVFGNLLLTLVTLGLFYPWARVRMAKYLSAHLAVTGSADMEGFTSELVAGQGAIGEEIANFFDVDIGL
jgi:uncharacterized membrane protein YjgN (DUF898 family)